MIVWKTGKPGEMLRVGELWYDNKIKKEPQ